VPYCDTDDLLVGDVLLGPNQNLSVWVDSAAEEMDSKLGFRYQVPIAPKPPATILAKHELLLLKDINKKLASGRFLLAQAQGSEEGQEHAYGRALVNDALNSLMLICNAEIDFVDAIPADDVVLSSYFTGPSIENQDEESLLLGFENTIMKSSPWWSRPGQVS
jgi:hypothetical protein